MDFGSLDWLTWFSNLFWTLIASGKYLLTSGTLQAGFEARSPGSPRHMPIDPRVNPWIPPGHM